MRKIYLFMLLALTAMTAKSQQSLDTPKAKPATNITAKGFTANWERVDSAEAYCVFVYDQKPVTRDGETVIIDEDFPYINQGSVIEPAGGDEMYVDLSEKGYTSTYGWSAYGYPNFIPGMVDGLLYSPYLDLRGNDGKYKIVVRSYATDGDTLQVRTHGSRGEQVHEIPIHFQNGGSDISVDTLSCDDGSRDLFFSVINLTANVAQADFIDRVQVLQDLKAGDVINTMVASNEAVMAFDDDLNDSVTSCRFTYPSSYTTSKTLYYNLYAAAHDFKHPDGSSPYTYVTSDFSQLVKVDLNDRTSEVVDGITSVKTNATADVRNDNVWYNLQGQRVSHPQHGIFIHNGKKVAVK